MTSTVASLDSQRRDHCSCCHPRTSTTAAEVARLRLSLSRLEAKHRRFADETNRIITEQLAEIQRLRDRSTE